nr:adenylate/guanylate cyclase domain-containing protein [Bacteroidota bacterium]
MDTHERRLTTIMFTDIFGYSALMGKSEQKALDLLSCHDEILKSIIFEEHGKIIKEMGDALFTEFSSVLNAYQAASKIQQEIKKMNLKKSKQDRLLVRIGIHIGDVVVKGDDLFGDGVNVAARLEHFSTPGGVCLSEMAYKTISSQVPDQLIKIEDVAFKNISEKYTVFQLPSIYPDEFAVTETMPSGSSHHDCKIKSIQHLPPEKFSLTDSLFIAIAVMVIIDFGFAYNIKVDRGVSLSESIAILSTFLFGITNLFMITVLTIIILRSQIRVRFEDVRDVDKMINLVVRKAGFREPVKQGDDLVFKPTIYNFLIWSAQKTRVNINGGDVTISGSYLFIKKLKKILKVYAGPPQS